MYTAWMIRNDGLAFPCVQHIYGNQDIADVEETLAAAEWLYASTDKPSTKELCLEFIRAWAAGFKFRDADSMVRVLTDVINGRPYKFLSINFIEQNAESIYNASTERSLEELNALVNIELNQEFMRARYGGMYNTNPESREMVFRISSAGFNWFDIIFQFVADNLSKIDTVTIVRDEEGTGEVDKYYRTFDGNSVYKQMPIDEFLKEKEKIG